MGHRLTKRRIPADTHVIELSAAGEIVVLLSINVVAL
jgi:hypothetical protein